MIHIGNSSSLNLWNVRSHNIYIGPEGVAVVVKLTDKQLPRFNMGSDSAPHNTLAVHDGHQVNELGSIVKRALDDAWWQSTQIPNVWYAPRCKTYRITCLTNQNTKKFPEHMAEKELIILIQSLNSQSCLTLCGPQDPRTWVQLHVRLCCSSSSCRHQLTDHSTDTNLKHKKELQKQLKGYGKQECLSPYNHFGTHQFCRWKSIEQGSTEWHIT